MITKKTDIDKIEIDIESGVIRCREKVSYIENGVEAASNTNSYCIEPGDGTPQPEKVAAVQQVFQTKEVTERFLTNRLNRLMSSQIRGMEQEITKIKSKIDKINDPAANK